MSSELPQIPDFTIQEERLQYGAEKCKQRDTAHLIWASKPRKEPSLKDLEFQTAEIVIPNKATGDLRSFFETEKKEIDIQSQPPHLIRVIRVLEGCELLHAKAVKLPAALTLY